MQNSNIVDYYTTDSYQRIIILFGWWVGLDSLYYNKTDFVFYF